MLNPSFEDFKALAARGNVVPVYRELLADMETPVSVFRKLDAAEDKAVGKLGSLRPWKKAKADRTVALMGCMVGVKPSQQLLDAYPFVDVFMPPSESTPLVNHLRQAEIDAEPAAEA